MDRDAASRCGDGTGCQRSDWRERVGDGTLLPGRPSGYGADGIERGWMAAVAGRVCAVWSGTGCQRSDWRERVGDGTLLPGRPSGYGADGIERGWMAAVAGTVCAVWSGT